MDQSKLITKKSTGKQIAEQIKKGAHSYPLLGYCVYWSMSSFRIPQDQFEKFVERVGMDKASYGKPATKKVIVTQVVDEYVDKNRAKAKAQDSADSLVYNLHHRDIDEQNDQHVNYRRETKIVFDKKTEQVTVDGAFKDEIEQKFIAYQNTYTTDQFRNMMLSFFQKECAAVAVRDRGGVYFIPIQAEAKLDMAAEIFKLVPGCEIERLPIVDTAQAKKSMWKALVSDVKSDIASLNDELDQLKKVSTKINENRVKRYKELRAKAEMYGDLLSQTAEDIVSDVKALEKRLKAKLELQGTEE